MKLYFTSPQIAGSQRYTKQPSVTIDLGMAGKSVVSLRCLFIFVALATSIGDLGCVELLKMMLIRPNIGI